jgi:hypothetical protein
MKKATAILGVYAVILFGLINAAAASPKSLVMNEPDRELVRKGIESVMKEEGYRLVSSDAYNQVFERHVNSFYEDITYRDLFIETNPVFRKIWSVIPSRKGLEAIVDIMLVSSPGSRWEKSYDPGEIFSFPGPEKFEREKMYNLMDVKASVDNLDRYFLMRWSGLFPELKPLIPVSDMMVKDNEVIFVLPDGVAGKSGVRFGDVILEINGTAAAGDVVKQIDQSLSQGSRVVLLIRRQGVEEIIALIGE